MPSTRIPDLFRRAREENRAALVAYITAGDPTPELTPSLAAALERGGVDLIELGVPFSDPIADGPMIQRASDRALGHGMNVRRVLEIAREIRAMSEIPLLLFTYLNPILRYGLDKLAADAAAAGIDGCLLTDLSVEEAGSYVGVMRASGLDTVFLAAPTSTAERRQLVARYSTGFVYLVSRTGVTGESASLSDSAGALVKAMREVTKLPLAVGFGISTREQVAAVARIADGVVVGSALVRVIEEHGEDPRLAGHVEAFARELAGGLRREVPA
ncbi:MAG: tryptophan synthase subunit alpha [Bryobacteraceae bacterium]|nr:tryptophan synthase subunit alpha [Bryobacteraceae bacterium]